MPQVTIKRVMHGQKVRLKTLSFCAAEGVGLLDRME